MPQSARYTGSPASSLHPIVIFVGYFSVLHKVHTPPPHLPGAHALKSICVTSKKLALAVLGVCDWVLVGLQDALLHELVRFWPILELFLQAVGPHVLLEVFLVALERWGGRTVGENVAYEIGGLGQQQCLIHDKRAKHVDVGAARLLAKVKMHHEAAIMLS